MQATLIFNLPEERELYNIFMAAQDYRAVIEGFHNYLRRQEKSGLTPSFDDIKENFYGRLAEINYE